MEVLWIAIGLLLMVVALLGCVLPVIPGLVLAYAALLLQQLRTPHPFSLPFLLGWMAIIIVVSIFEYYLPVWSVKKFGGTKYGAWGCTLGFIACFWLGPWGVIIGPFLGALLGELLGKKTVDHALKSALGSFIGFLGSTVLKLCICSVMIYYLICSI
jgi:uncharacterized protein YqgC (DUF456 family)